MASFSGVNDGSVFNTILQVRDMNVADKHVMNRGGVGPCSFITGNRRRIYLDKNEDLPEGEHNYIFVGRVGQFCPIMPGKGGALLLREAGLTDTGERKYASVTGAKDYRWLESEAVYQLQMQEDIDKRYFNREVDEAVEEISKYGDFNWFVGDDGVAPWTAPDLPWSDAQEEAARNFDVR